MEELFQPWQSLFDGVSEPACRACVVLPARNEEESLAATLDALAGQVDLNGVPLAKSSFEILLLLNNCEDRSVDIAHDWAKKHREVRLYIAERSLDRHEAFVGTARRMLMDTAWRRLSVHEGRPGILSTDADSLVRNDWIAQNLSALTAGADAVGGLIVLRDEDLALLPDGARHAYQLDSIYQYKVAKLEDLLDPQLGDPWPRHLHHFGASLACTPDVYSRSGGLPAVKPLEDVAFVGRLRRIGARLRHHPDVVVQTSARMTGRAQVGLSGQLTLWQKMSERHEIHLVQSAEWLIHRFKTLANLRKEADNHGIRAVDYLATVDCDRLITDAFTGAREKEINSVISDLSAALEEYEGPPLEISNAQVHPVDSCCGALA